LPNVKKPIDHSPWITLNNRFIMNKTTSEFIRNTRTEHDLIGTMEIPAASYFGIQTLRAVENFDISRSKLHH